MVQYDSLYDHMKPDYTFVETITIGIGGTCTVKTNGKTIDLVDAGINYNTKTLSGKDAHEMATTVEPWNIEYQIIKLEDINELIVEGFYINDNNRSNVVKLINEINVTKIPRRD